MPICLVQDHYLSILYSKKQLNMPTSTELCPSVHLKPKLVWKYMVHTDYGPRCLDRTQEGGVPVYWRLSKVSASVIDLLWGSLTQKSIGIFQGLLSTVVLCCSVFNRWLCSVSLFILSVLLHCWPQQPMEQIHKGVGIPGFEVRKFILSCSMVMALKQVY